MNRKRVARKLDALDVRVDHLEAERRALERQAFGAELPEGERATRYPDVTDPALRGQLAALERAAQELRREQAEAAVTYWSNTVAITQAQLEDLRSEGAMTKWRRDVWWDLFTLFWIFAGGGWIYRKLPGAVAGALFTVVLAWPLMKQRDKRRAPAIRDGEDVLRSAQNELAQAQRELERAAPPADP